MSTPEPVLIVGGKLGMDFCREEPASIVTILKQIGRWLESYNKLAAPRPAT